MIYVARHCQTDQNKEGRLQGRNGKPLNLLGIVQAQRLRGELIDTEFACVFSSPQPRVIQTGRIITDIEIIIDPSLDVFDLGEADGLKKDEVKMVGGIPDPNIYKGVEDVNVFLRRIFSFMHDLETEIKNKNSNVLILGQKCTPVGIDIYFGIPNNGRQSLSNGEYKVYDFNNAKGNGQR